MGTNYDNSNKAIFDDFWKLLKMGKMKSNNKISVFSVFSAYKLPILAHLSIVFAYTQIFMLILSEMLKIALNYAKNRPILFPIQIWKFIHQSKANIKFSRFVLFSMIIQSQVKKIKNTYLTYFG